MSFLVTVTNEIINSRNSTILLGLKSLRENLLARISSTILIKKVNLETLIPESNKNIFIDNELLLLEERLGYIDTKNNSVIYNHTTAEKKLLINFMSFEGTGKVKIYSKFTENRESKYLLNELVISKTKDHVSLELEIKSNVLEYKSSIYFEVISQTENENYTGFIFKLQISLPSIWNQVEPGKNVVTRINSNSEYLGYMPVIKEYESILVQINEKTQVEELKDKIIVYFKYKVVDSSTEVKLVSSFDIPSKSSSDYEVEVNPITKTVSIKI
jgi:hypothetical protein